MAVKTAAQIKADADEKLPSNQRRLVSPMDVREPIKDLADSTVFVGSDGYADPAFFPEFSSLSAVREGIPDDGSDASPYLFDSFSTAISDGRALEFKSGSQYNFTSIGAAPAIAAGETLEIFALGDGALFYANAASAASSGNFRAPALATDLTITQNVTQEDTRVYIDASLMQPGAVLTFSASAIVDDLHNYAKRWSGTIASIAPDFTYVEMAEPHDFFWTVGEAGLSVNCYHGGRLLWRNIGIQATAGRGLAFVRLQHFDVDFCGLPVRGAAKGGTNRPLTISQGDGGIIRNPLLTLGEYNLFVTNGHANLRVIDALAKDTRHGIDFNTWARDGTVERLRGINCVGNLQSHGSLRIKYLDCDDAVDGSEIGTNLRCVGGGLWRCKLRSPVALGDDGVHGPRLRSAYQYLADNAIRTYEDYDAPQDYIGCEDSHRVEVRRTRAKRITVNGAVRNVDEVMIDSVSRFEDPLSVERVNLLQADDVPIIEATPTDESGVQAVSIRTTPGIGAYPRLRYRTTLYSDDTTAVGVGLNKDRACRLYDVLRTSGADELHRWATITVEAFGFSGSDMLVRRKVFALAIDRENEVVTVSSGSDVTPAIGDIDVSLQSVSYTSDLEDSRLDFTVRATVTDAADTVECCKYELNEEQA